MEGGGQASIRTSTFPQVKVVVNREEEAHPAYTMNSISGEPDPCMWRTEITLVLRDDDVETRTRFFSLFFCSPIDGCIGSTMFSRFFSHSFPRFITGFLAYAPSNQD